VQIVRSVVIDRHIDDVFAYIANPLNEPAHLAAMDRVACDPPRRIAWRADDDLVEVTYELEEVWTSTRVTRRDVAPGGWLRRAALARDIARRLHALKRELELRGPR
jgi:hypothetical protein